MTQLTLLNQAFPGAAVLGWEMHQHGLADDLCAQSEFDQPNRHQHQYQHHIQLSNSRRSQQALNYFHTPGHNHGEVKISIRVHCRKIVQHAKNGRFHKQLKRSDGRELFLPGARSPAAG